MSLKAHSFQALINDRYSGSSGILKNTIEWMLSSLKEGQSSEHIVAQLGELCRRHPAMGLLQSLLRFFQNFPVNSGRIQAWMAMYQKHETAACRYLAHHLSKFESVLLHSNSGLLYSALAMLPDPLDVFCTESRPGFEGRILAERLAATNHRVHLITDMAAFEALHRLDTVAFGCDCVTPRGVVNKIGTAALAQAASLAGKKTCVVATSEKRVDWNEEILTKQGPAREIYNSRSSKIRVENYYFDLTPPGLVHTLILERGPEKNPFPS